MTNAAALNISEYTLVAEARGQQVLYFRKFGSYQGEWIMLAKDSDHFLIYKDWYGSCSGCDALEGRFGDGDTKYTAEAPAIQEFIKEYEPFLLMERDAALRLALRENSLLTVTPANQREWEHDDIPMERVGREFAAIVKADWGMAKPADIVFLSNLETRRKAIEDYGIDRFIEELAPTVLDERGEDKLMRAEVEGAPEPFVFLFLKDASTPRRYVLRVPPTTAKVLEGVAWSFEVPVAKYAPAVET